MNTKVRLVRCPKCRNVLQEPSDVPVYRCGGCSTVLQVKNRQNGTADTTARRHEKDSGKRKIEQASGEQVVGSDLAQQSPVNSFDEPGQTSDPNHLHNSTEKGHDDPESSPEAMAHNGTDGDQDATKKSESGLVEAPSNGVGEFSSSKRKIEQLSDDQEAGSSSNHQLLVDAIDEPDQNSGPNDLCRSTELLGHDQDAAMKADKGRVGAPLLVNSIDEPDRSSDHNDPRTSTELSCHEDPDSSPEATAYNRMDQDQDQNQEEDHYQDAAKKQERVIVEYSSGKQKLSDDQESGRGLNQRSLGDTVYEPDRNNDRNEPRSSSELSYHEDPESSPEAAIHNRMDQDHDHDHDLERFMFTNNGISENHMIRKFEESSRELSASPEKCSFSELNEVEEPSRAAMANLKIARDSDGGSKSSFKSLIAEKLLDTRPRRVAYLDEDDMISEDESADLCHDRRFERISSVETLENQQIGGMGYYGYEGSVSSFDGNDYQVPRKNHIGSSHPYRRSHEFDPLNSRRVKNERRSMDVRSSFGDHRRVGSFHENPRHRAPLIPENPKLERLELLKMVRELQDQLERTNISNSRQQIPSYYNHGNRMAFSGETMAVNARRDGGGCHHCRPQDRHFSAQLPRQLVCCNGPHYVPSTCYSSHCSGSSSPQNHLESEFSVPVRSNPEPDEHRPRNEIPKPYRSPKKRYVRPIAGGSPWITCYRCSALLQLPQSFLVFKRRCHSLRCGMCSKVLNFTLSNRTHVSRYYPEETIAAPPSSEVEEYATRAGPVSCSDRSFQKSCSTETERYASREFGEERSKATMSRDSSSSTRPSSSKISGQRKTTSEIEEIEPSAGSPLHWLMGYASPSKVIRG